MGIEVALALGAISTIGAIQQSETQESIARMNAQQAREDAEHNAEKKREEYERLQASQKAAYSSSGVKVDGGTPAEVLAQTEIDGELSAMEIIYSGNQQAKMHNFQADAINRNKYINGASSGVGTFLAAGGAK